MTTTEKYNGWTNYETWNVALWMGNDEGSYRHWCGVAQSCWDDAEASGAFSRLERARIDLADILKSEYEEAMHDMLERAGQSSSMWADLLGAALSEVDWDEIAGNQLDEVDQSEEPEDHDETDAPLGSGMTIDDPPDDVDD